VRRLVGHDGGQDLIEYGLVVALVSLIAVVAMTTVGITVNQVLWQTIAAMMNGV
jgi:Flp pilus assembly pilin Flp